MAKVLLALGANIPGRWGAPQSTLAAALAALAEAGIMTTRRSSIYLTAPLGNTRQPPYLNIVVLGVTSVLPRRLLLQLKRIEKAAGRRLGRRLGPRPLDIDILHYRGFVLGWPPRRRLPGRLILPHPELHRRVFVLAPLLDVSPHWRHPVLGVTAKTLFHRLPRGRGFGEVVRW